jgi:hypothetical protein
MMSHVSIGILCVGVTLAAVLFLWRASGRNHSILFVLIGWMVVQSAAALTGFYTVTDTVPPRFILLIAPPAGLILYLFVTQRGRNFIDRFHPEKIITIHTVRIGVEVVLFLLAEVRIVPVLMTWKGRNFDILTGITAPLIGYFGYTQRSFSPRFLIIWNLAGLVLLFNVVFYGILSAPSPFQQFSFEQPNLLPLYFPFLFVPSLLVPVMLFAHLVSLRALLKGTRTE